MLLGPQPEYKTLKLALRRLDPGGCVAVITAGWEEDELAAEKLGPLQSCLPKESFNLELFRRSEQLFTTDKELIRLLRERQDKLRHLRNVYFARLDDLLDAARATLRREDPLLDLAAERESAIDMVRQLDRQYLVRTRQICDDYELRLDVVNRPDIRSHRNEISEKLADAKALLISGGNAAIILNRLRLFGVLDMDQSVPVIAWSGGAMALADQIVLFHDSPPQGRGNAEVLRAGMSMFDRFLPLPDATNRLLLDDELRVALFARRFQDYQCVVFDENTFMDRSQGHWWANDQTVTIGENGDLPTVNVEASA